MPATTFPITRDEIARVLDLQARAYETLIWLSHVSFARAEMLNERTADVLRDAAGCRRWVEEHFDKLPPRLQPGGGEAEAFALLFSSFFQTSFRIEKREVTYAPPFYVIAANRDEAAGKKKLGARNVPRYLRRKRAGEAQHLEYRALTLVNEGPEDARFRMAAAEVRRTKARGRTWSCGRTRASWCTARAARRTARRCTCCGSRCRRKCGST